MDRLWLTIFSYILIGIGVWIGGDFIKGYYTGEGPKPKPINIAEKDGCKALLISTLRLLLGLILAIAGAIILFVLRGGNQ